jgi:hypothetical protein
VVPLPRPPRPKPPPRCAAPAGLTAGRWSSPLAELNKAGILTDEGLATQKARILG